MKRREREARDETSRRRFLHLAAGAAALPISSRSARAQAYPTRIVRWVFSATASRTGLTLAVEFRFDSVRSGLFSVRHAGPRGTSAITSIFKKMFGL